MRATTILRGSHVQSTYRTLIGILAATGMRVGEAIGLDHDDFDAVHGMLTSAKANSASLANCRCTRRPSLPWTTTCAATIAPAGRARRPC